LANLRRLWLEAVADESVGLDPDPVFDDLKGKYRSPTKVKGR
jgi:hypothetical protein